MDAVTKAQIELTQAQADAQKAALKAEAERVPIDSNECESECARAIHDVLMEEEAAAEELAAAEQMAEEIEEEEEEQLTWQEERVAKLETELQQIKTGAEAHYSEVMSKLDALKPSNPPKSELGPNPNPAPVSPAAIPEPKESVAPAVEQQRRKVRKI